MGLETAALIPLYSLSSALLLSLCFLRQTRAREEGVAKCRHILLRRGAKDKNKPTTPQRGGLSPSMADTGRSWWCVVEEWSPIQFNLYLRYVFINVLNILMKFFSKAFTPVATATRHCSPAPALRLSGVPALSSTSIKYWTTTTNTKPTVLGG